MRRRPVYVALVVLVGAAAVLWSRGWSRPPDLDGALVLEVPPRTRPDYVGATIPPNIAPLNFRVEEPGVRYCVAALLAGRECLRVVSKGPEIAIPAEPWRRMLAEGRGERILFSVCVETPRGGWRRYAPIELTVAPEETDRYLVYRLMNAAYNLWGGMSICERDLQSYKERVILDNRSVGDGCVNCHTFLNNGTGRMVMHLRPGRVDYGNGMVFVDDGEVKKVDTRTRFNRWGAAYASWHPSGRVLAFSVNKGRQLFHSARVEVRDVFDLESDLALFLADEYRVTSTAAISDPDVLETYPAWSADGRHLYFCSAPITWADRETAPPDGFRQTRYGLMRIGYDAATGRWGELETVLSAQETGLSIGQPRPSPDGRFLLFCMYDYGPFPIHQISSDLYLMDLETGGYRRLECNSDRTEAWHSWSSNGRWIAFASKRDDGLFGRPYFSYIDPAGREHRPFVMPQRWGGFYEAHLKTYNMPELVAEPMPVAGEELAAVLRSADWISCGLPVTSPTPRAASRRDNESPEGGAPNYP